MVKCGQLNVILLGLQVEGSSDTWMALDSTRLNEMSQIQRITTYGSACMICLAETKFPESDIRVRVRKVWGDRTGARERAQ